MDVGGLNRANPYLAFSSVLQRGGALVGAAGSTDQKNVLTNLIGPGLKSQTLSKAGRLDSLYALISQAIAHLGELSSPANAPARLVVASSTAPADSIGTATVRYPTLVADSVLGLGPGRLATFGTLVTSPIQLNLAQASAARAATLNLGPVRLDTSQAQTQASATMIGARVTLEPSETIPATRAVLTTNRIMLDDSTASAAVLTAAPIALDLSATAPATRAVLVAAPVGADFSNPTPAQAAQLVGASVALDYSGATGSPSAAVLTSGPVTFDTHAASATAATMTFDPVQLAASSPVTATLTGAPLTLSANHATNGTDFGALRVNGYTLDLGRYDGAEDPAAAAQFLVDRINAHADAPVSAQLDASGQALVLTATVPGTSGSFSIDTLFDESDGDTTNNASAGFALEAAGEGQDPVTDFGSVTINGVTTVLGTLENAWQTPSSAAQYLADRFNANAANDFVASVGGAGGDQLVLTSKTTGSDSRLSVEAWSADSDGIALNEGHPGLTVGLVTTGQDGEDGTTDFGSVTINGVTTDLGSLVNAEQSTASAAQLLADRFNANAANDFVASVGGADGDQLVLTSKTTGSAANLRVEATSTAFHGLEFDQSASGEDAELGTTDFGWVTINGVGNDLGSLANNGQSAASAAQYLVDRFNSNAANGFVASVGGAHSDQVILSSKTVGQGAILFASLVSQGAFNGFTADQTVTGSDAGVGTTDYGSVTIDGVTTVLGALDSTDLTPQSAALYLVDRLNANAANTFVASVGGAGDDQLVLTAKTLGSAGNLSIDASSAGAWSGLFAGQTAAALDADDGTTDFGSVTINGVTTSLGTFDNNGQSTATAALYLVDRLNANAANAFVASVGGASGDQLVLSAKTQGPAGNLLVNTSTQSSTSGLSAGMTAQGQDASGGITDFGSVTINGMTIEIGAYLNQGLSDLSAAQLVADILNSRSDDRFTASVLTDEEGQKLVLSANQLGSAGTMSIDAATSPWSGFAAGQLATGQDVDQGQTDFGWVSINSITTTLGTLPNAGLTPQLAAQYLADTFNANPDNPFVASVGGEDGDQVILTANDPSPGVVLNTYSVGRGDHNGFAEGQTTVGQEGDAGSTDFGTVTINGQTIVLGRFSNEGLTPSAAAQMLVDQLNADSYHDFVASVGGANSDSLVLTSKAVGAQAYVGIDAVSGEAFSGLSLNALAWGQDAVAGQTDFGSVTINGVTTALGVLDNTAQTGASAARWLVDRLNANAANVFVASLTGPNDDQVMLRSRTAGAAGSLTVGAVGSDSNGDPLDDGTLGLGAGQLGLGHDAAAGSTDFGSVTINGVTTTFETLDNATTTTAEAARYVVDRLNQTNPTITASLEDGRLKLAPRNRSEGAALAVTATFADSDGDPTNDVSLGLSSALRRMSTGEGPAPAAAASEAASSAPLAVDRAQVRYLLEAADNFVTSFNDYLEALSLDARTGLKEVASLTSKLVEGLVAVKEPMAKLGLGLKDDRLVLDRQALDTALSRDPEGTIALFAQIKQALDTPVATQQTTLENARSVTLTSNSQTAELARAATALRVVSLRSEHLQTLLNSIGQAQALMGSQSTKLKAQALLPPATRSALPAWQPASKKSSLF